MSTVVPEEKTALIVVDMQNGFCHEDGSLYSPASENAIKPVVNLVEEFKDDMPIIYTKDVHPKDQFGENDHYNEFERWGEHVIEGSWEAEFVSELPEPDHVVTKHTYDAFYETEMAGWLDAHNIDTLVFCGTLANVCVLHSARSAALRDFRTVIVEDALGYIEEEDRKFAVEHAEWLFGERCEAKELESQ